MWTRPDTVALKRMHGQYVGQETNRAEKLNDLEVLKVWIPELRNEVWAHRKEPE